MSNDFFTERDNNFGIISNKTAYYYSKVFNIEIVSLFFICWEIFYFLVNILSRFSTLKIILPGRFFGNPVTRFPF